MILITGAFGQDGQILQKYLSKENLLLVSRNRPKLDITIKGRIELGDLQDKGFVRELFSKYNITKVFNLATNSFVERDTDYIKVFRKRCSIFDNLIEVIVDLDLKDKVWIFHPLSSEIFGVPDTKIQGLNSRVAPINPYGIQKSIELIKSRYLVDRGFKIFHPIMFNHESFYRKPEYFTKKVVSFFIRYGQNWDGKPLLFYNSTSSRDFSSAYGFAEAMVLAMQKKLVGDEIFGSGINLTIRQFIVYILEELNINYRIQKNDDNLISFYCNDQEVAREVERSDVDAKRIFCCDKKFRNAEFENLNFIGGRELVKKLIIEQLENEQH